MLDKYELVSDYSKLSAAEREEFIRSVCADLNIPVGLRLIGFAWMNQPDGSRSMVPYAKRGATDRIRAKHSVSLYDLVRVEIDGCVAFKAYGQDGQGRKEVAIGAAPAPSSTKGEAFASAVMTAETRAGRRLTLKFAGLGLLDESEISAANGEIIETKSEVTAQDVFQPAMANDATGTEVKNEKEVERTNVALPVSEAEPQPNPAGTQEVVFSPSVNNASSIFINGVEVKPVEEPKKKRARRKKNEIAFDEPTPAPKAIKVFLVDASGKDLAQLPDYPNDTGIPKIGDSITVGDKVLRVHTWDAANLTIKVMAIPVLKEQVSAALPVTVILPAQAGGGEGRSHEGASAVESVQSTQPSAVIDQQTMQGFLQRLRPYNNGRLDIEGKMRPSQQGGVRAKVEKFFVAKAGVKSRNELTPEHWETTLGLMDKMYAEQGAEALVQHIEQTIGG